MVSSAHLNFSNGIAAPMKKASTVILTREGSEGVEVFLVKRHDKSGFMAGAYVFPGGKVDEADGQIVQSHSGASLRVLSERLAPTPGKVLGEEEKRGLVVAACRELFEEAGILLARFKQDHRIINDSSEVWEELQDARQAIHSGELSFSDFLEERNLVLDVSSMGYWAHWVTPSVEKRRFDTRFFVASLPQGQTPDFDKHETIHAAWMNPKAALLAQGRGEIFLPPPTLRTLEDMTCFRSQNELMAFIAKEVPFPIMPKILQMSEGFAILLPWDKEYSTTKGESLEAALPSTHPFLESPSRLVFDGKGWTSVDCRL